MDLRIASQPLHTRLAAASAGNPGDDVSDIIVVRDHWVQQRARQTSRKGNQQLRFKLGTFNVNGMMPSQDLSSWLGTGPQVTSDASSAFTETTLIPPINKVSPLSVSDLIKNPFDPDFASAPTVPQDLHQDPDLFVLGFQELDLSTEALLYSTKTAKEEAWCTAIFAALGEKAELYEKLASKQLVGMLLVIIVRKSLRKYFGGIQTCAAGAGIMGVMGNKGGVAIRLQFAPPSDELIEYHPTVFTFVNAHLAAFDEMFEKRNADYHDLCRRLGFSGEATSDTSENNPPYTLVDKSNIFESDILFWLGDLNYRIDLAGTDIRTILASKAWQDKFNTLLHYDQLKLAIGASKAFKGFKEHSITHLPTYRFSSGLLTDDLGYDVKRKPAWTDRVLLMDGPYVQVQPLSYTGHPQITMSDHRPVSADFRLDVDLFDKKQLESHFKTHYKKVIDIDETSKRPAVKIEPTSVNLGKLRYRQATSATLTIENIGKIPAVFRFVALEENSPPYPEWLRIEPMAGLILPGEALNVNLTSIIHDNTAFELNQREKQINETLILHTAQGKDHFIPIDATYEYTCFANKLSRLVRLPSNIRALSGPNDLLTEDRGINTPREMMRLINWLMTTKIQDDMPFTSIVEEILIGQIIECLDNDRPFIQEPQDADPIFAAAIGETLLRMLKSLPEPVVPSSLHERCAQTQNREEAFELLDDLPAVNVNVWISITAFLHFIGQQSPDDVQKRTEHLASIFAPVLFKSPPDRPNIISPLAERNFLLYFIG